MAKSKGKNPLIDQSEEVNSSESQETPKSTEVMSAKNDVDAKLERVYKNAKTIHHDLYKLTVAKFKKNLAVSGSDQLLLDDVEHCHYFHSVDSNGRPQTHSSSIGGHFHVMEIKQQKNGAPLVRCASGPVQFGRKPYIDAKGKKKFKTVVIPINDFDSHTHEVQYLASSEVKQRVANMEATQVDSYWQNYAAPPKEVL